MTPEQYEPSRPYTFDDTVHTPIGQWRTTSGKAAQMQNLPRKVNQGALTAMNRALGVISHEGFAFAHWKRRSGCRGLKYCPICSGGWRRLQRESTRI